MQNLIYIIIRVQTQNSIIFVFNYSHLTRTKHEIDLKKHINKYRRRTNKEVYKRKMYKN